jgi:hypothetical protein
MAKVVLFNTQCRIQLIAFNNDLLMALLHLVVDDLRMKIRCCQKEGVTLIATLLGFTRFLCEYGGSGFSNPTLLTTFFMRKLAYALGESLSQAVVCFN